MFGARWRWNATRALAILRFAGGRKVPPPIQRMRADDLMAAVFPDQAACAENLTGDIRIPDHPLVKETIDNCLYEAMDLEGLTEMLRRIEDGRIRTVAIDTAEPSPFSHEILNANPYAYLDDAPLEERRARAVQLRRTLRTDVTDGAGALDAEAIRTVAEEAWPLVRDADELHEALLGMVIVPARAEWAPFFAELAAARRATAMDGFWIAAERLDLVRRACPDARFTPAIEAPALARALPESREACVAEILRGWFECTVPLRASELARDLALPRDMVEIALAQLEAEGQILRGHFLSRGGEDEIEWAHRRLLARIHRLTIGRLRREIEPVTTAQFAAFRGALAASGGRHPTARRRGHFAGDPAVAGSGMGGGRMGERRAAAPHRQLRSGAAGRAVPLRRSDVGAALAASGLRARRPTDRAGACGLRALRRWRSSFARTPAGCWHLRSRNLPKRCLIPRAKCFRALQTQGASFFHELVRNTGRLAGEVEDALWELVAAGLVTADGFENLRALIDPHRRRGEGRGRTARPRYAPGRWALLRHGEDAATEYVERFARQLLQRWGVVFRDIAARETLAPAWRDILVVLRKMETRGEIRGGRFAAAFVGEQFALPEALDLLRAVRRAGEVDVEWDALPPWLAGERSAVARTGS